MLKEIESVPVAVRGLDASGAVTSEDYARVFAPLVDEVRRAKSRLRLLLQFGPNFKGFTVGALWADARLGLGYARVMDGCAVVSDIEWIRTPARSIGVWMPCPVRVYRNDERNDAVAWLNSLPESADASVWDMTKAYVGGTAAAIISLGMLAFSTKRHTAA